MSINKFILALMHLKIEKWFPGFLGGFSSTTSLFIFDDISNWIAITATTLEESFL